MVVPKFVTLIEIAVNGRVPRLCSPVDVSSVGDGRRAKKSLTDPVVSGAPRVRHRESRLLGRCHLSTLGLVATHECMNVHEPPRAVLGLSVLSATLRQANEFTTDIIRVELSQY